MPTHSQTLLGRPIWYELMTTDTAAAEAFYKKVVGWSAVPMKEAPMPYTVFNRAGDVGVAGMMQKPDDMPMPPFWAMYIGVPKFDAAADQIKRLGGSELSPVIDIPNIGKMQMMRDPQGAAFYIMEPAQPEGPPQTDPEIGDGSWLELMTTDAPAAMRFYNDVFKWEPSQAMDMGEMGTYQMFNRAHGMIGGMMNKPPQMADVPPNWGIYFRVPEINAAVDRIKAGGGQILNGPMEVPGGDWIVNAMDPQGAAFALHERRRT